MKKTILRTTTACLAAVAMTGQAFASGSCAKPAEYAALKTAAIQQRLMVAALYCDDVGAYNRFVLSYRGALQDSDAALLGYFKRTGGGRAGEAGYHAYKTSLANRYSLQSIRRRGEFCDTATAAFSSSSDPLNATLGDFINTVSVPEADPYACLTVEARVETVTGGSSGGSGPMLAARR
ncbi:MAG TPA: hypothetical protein VGG10_16950 [Rhizomicrobium sp.]|jgi:hypothetical protein